ncbi:MAG TPA: CzcE family metal-binding protein [Bradyrhizobium sp.]|nr:CzcE family metal-binding protein [Bradyrhizobium sp.]
MNVKQLIAFAVVLVTSASAFSLPLPRLDLLGKAAPESAAARTIVITSDTKYVNVTGGETIRFVVGEKSFLWNFDGRMIDSFDLNRTAPLGMLDHRVTVYVAPNPMY